jgi:hypothetical protein
MDVPDRVRRTPPDARGRNVSAWYVPANTRSDLPKGTTALAMDDFLMSEDLRSLMNDVGKDMVADARQEAISQGLNDSGEYVSSFESRGSLVVSVENQGHDNPRWAVSVGNTSGHAAAVEFGSSESREAHRVLGRVGARYHTPKGDVA